jgi:hypothetical protein
MSQSDQKERPMTIVNDSATRANVQRGHRTADVAERDDIDVVTLSPIVDAGDDPIKAAPSRPRSGRSRAGVGWILVAFAVGVTAAFAVMVLRPPSSEREPVMDAKDHPGYGPVVSSEREPVMDAKDHPGYGPVVSSVRGPVMDAKDHPGYGPVTTTCEPVPRSTDLRCSAG